MRGHPLGPLDLILPWCLNDLLKEFGGATDAILGIVPHSRQLCRRESLPDGFLISQIERLHLFDGNAEQHHRPRLTVIEESQEPTFKLRAGVVIEIHHDENSIGGWIEGSTISAELRRKLVEESFMPRVGRVGGVSGDPALSAVLDDLPGVARKKSG